MRMKMIKQMINELQATTSKLGKQDILKKYKDNEDCTAVLHFLLNDYIVTGIGKKAITKNVWQEGQVYTVRGFETIHSFLSWLDGGTGSDQQIRVVQSYSISYEDGEYKDIILGLASKDIKLGVSADSINKAYGYTLIPTFDLQLTHSYEKHEKKMKWPVAITDKLDGNRVAAIKRNNSVKFYSRNGKEVEGLVDLIPQIEKLPDNVVYDGELLAIDDGKMTVLERFRETSKRSKTKGDKKGLEFHIFDLLPVQAFDAGGWDKPYSHRRNILDTKLTNRIIKEKLDLLKIVKALYIGNDKAKVRELELDAYARGSEGIMINSMDAPYECKRSYGVMKIKEFFTADILVTGIEEGKPGTKYAGSLGSLVCEWKGNSVGLNVSGMSDLEREKWWVRPEEIIGKVIEIGHNGETQNQDGGEGVRFPRFLRIRDDKTAKDVNYEG